MNLIPSSRNTIQPRKIYLKLSMNSRYKKFFLIVIIYLLLVTASYAVIPPIPQKPPQYVVDLADIIENDVEIRLNGHLKELEQKTTAQVVVLTLLSLEGESLEDFY